MERVYSHVKKLRFTDCELTACRLASTSSATSLLKKIDAVLFRLMSLTRRRTGDWTSRCVGTSDALLGSLSPKSGLFPISRETLQ